MNYENHELQEQYRTDPHFRKKADQMEDQYLYLQAKSTQLSQEMLISEAILERFPADNAMHLYFWYGFMQPEPGRSASRLALNFFRLFRPE
jgi:hypothetical protein